MFGDNTWQSSLRARLSCQARVRYRSEPLLDPDAWAQFCDFSVRDAESPQPRLHRISKLVGPRGRIDCALFAAADLSRRLGTHPSLIHVERFVEQIQRHNGINVADMGLEFQRAAGVDAKGLRLRRQFSDFETQAPFAYDSFEQFAKRAEDGAYVVAHHPPDFAGDGHVINFEKRARSVRFEDTQKLLEFTLFEYVTERLVGQVVHVWSVERHPPD